MFYGKERQVVGSRGTDLIRTDTTKKHEGKDEKEGKLDIPPPYRPSIRSWDISDTYPCL